MKTQKKLASILLALVLIIGLMPTALAAESSYQDTKGHWAEEAIERWSSYGVIQGNNDQFNPNGPLTRGHMAAVLSRLLNLPDAPDAGFTDVKADDWCAEYINKCAAAGIMLGSDGKASPNAPITRQQAIVMLGRALGIQPVESPDLSHFQDGGAISDYAKGYVAAMNEAGIVGGVSSDTLAGGSDITRAATVTILNRAISTYANEAGTTVEATGSGIVLVAADQVTVTGSAGSVLVSQGVSDGIVTLSSSAGSVTVIAENATVVVSSQSKAEDVTLTKEAVGSKVVVENGAEVGTVTTEAAKSTVSVSGKVENVSATATAEQASVEVTKNAAVGDISVSGEKTAVSVSGKVENVTVTDTAADTTVKANSGSTISKVDNAAEGTTVSGSGKVENVTTSGDNTTVSTNGTKVEAEEGTVGTSAGGKDVTGGSSTTTGSSGSSSDSGSASPHVHAYTETVTKAPTCTETGVRTFTCYCGSSYTEEIPAVGHSYVYTRDESTHSRVCSVCGDVLGPEAHIVGDNGTCSACGLDGFAARIGTTGYMNLQDALNIGGEVVLLKNIAIVPEGTGTGVVPQMSVTKDTTLNLNGKTLGVNTPEEEISYTPAIMEVLTGATLTINGEGTISAEAGNNNSYGIDINGGNVVVNGGNHYGAMTAFQVEQGSLTINNGFFDMAPTCKAVAPQHAKYIVNCIDAAYKDNSATISIKGGTFVNFDPSNNPEGADTSYVASGYDVLPEAQKNGETWYTIVSGAVATTAGELETALAGTASDVYLADNIALSTALEIKRSVNIISKNGSELKLADDSGDNRVININNNTTPMRVTLTGVKVVGPTSGTYTRGISIYNNTGKLDLVLENCEISASYYALNVAGANAKVNVSVKKSVLTGWCAAQTWSAGSKFVFEGCTLIGNNDKGYNAEGWNDFATFVINSDASGSELTFTSCRIEANQTTGNDQDLISIRPTGSKVTLDGCTYFANSAEIEDESLGDFLKIYSVAADLVLVIDGETIPIG